MHPKSIATVNLTAQDNLTEPVSVDAVPAASKNELLRKSKPR
jgi:hypothetical protein